MSTKKNQVTNLGEAISVLVQVANLAQKSGILSFEDAVVVKSSIDFIDEANRAAQSQAPVVVPSESETDGPK